MGFQRDELAANQATVKARVDELEAEVNTLQGLEDRWNAIKTQINEGKLPEAVGMFEKYLSIAPNGQFAAQAKQMVAQLKK